MSSERILVSPKRLLSTEFGSCTIPHRNMIPESAANRRWVFTLICLGEKGLLYYTKNLATGMTGTLTL